MARIFSWKLDDSKYSYVVKPTGSSSYISNRITSNDGLAKLIEEVSKLNTFEAYKAEYVKMNSEIMQYYGTCLPSDDASIREFYDTGTKLDGKTNYVILTGKDGGSGSGGNGNSGDGGGNGGGGFDWDKYNEFIDYIQGLIDAAKEEIEKKNKEIQDLINKKLQEQQGDSWDKIEEAREELENVRKELEEKLKSAQDALSKAEELFNLGGEITPEQLLEVLSSYSTVNDWFETYGDFVKDWQSDYDEAKKTLGGMGYAQDLVHGMLSFMAESMNTISGTIGTVSSEWDASKGSITMAADWVNASAGTVGNVVRFMSASGALISDMAKYVNGSGFSSLVMEEINAMSGTIIDNINVQYGGIITSINQTMDGINGMVQTIVNRLNEVSGTLISVGEKMDADDASMEEWATKFNYLCGYTYSAIETLSAENGILQSVSNQIVESDDCGPKYYYVNGATKAPETFNDSDRVYYKDGHWYSDCSRSKLMSPQPDGKYIFPKYSNSFMSYIDQRANSIALTVMGEGSGDTNYASIFLELLEDESVINLIADKVVTTNFIASAISAGCADIGGFSIGQGVIKSWGDGIYFDAVNGQYSFNGDITARSLTLMDTAKKDLDNTVASAVSDAIDEAIGDAVSDAVDDWLTACGSTLGSGDKVTVESSSTTIDGQSVSVKIIKVNDKEKARIIDYGDSILTNVGYGNGLFDSSGNLTGGSPGDHYVKIDKTGLLQAYNAVIYGTIYANAGQIGGWSIRDQQLEVDTRSASNYGNGNVTIINPKHIVSYNYTGGYYDSECGVTVTATSGIGWELKDDGSGQLANGNIKWKGNGGVEVRGDIVATSFETQENEGLSVRMKDGEFQFLYKKEKVAFFKPEEGSDSENSTVNLWIKVDGEWKKLNLGNNEVFITGETVVAKDIYLVQLGTSYSISGKKTISETTNISADHYYIVDDVYYSDTAFTKTLKDYYISIHKTNAIIKIRNNSRYVTMGGHAFFTVPYDKIGNTYEVRIYKFNNGRAESIKYNWIIPDLFAKEKEVSGDSEEKYVYDISPYQPGTTSGPKYHIAKSPKKLVARNVNGGNAYYIENGGGATNMFTNFVISNDSPELPSGSVEPETENGYYLEIDFTSESDYNKLINSTESSVPDWSEPLP